MATAAEVIAGGAAWGVDCSDALAGLRGLPDGCVQCCLTSPPFFALRSYLPAGHPDKGNEIGLEDTPSAYVARLVEVFREVRRVLHPSGVLWLNLGDGYAAGSGRGGGNHLGTGQGRVDAAGAAGVSKRGRGVKAKNLIGAPWMLAFALRADGWCLRCAPPLVKDNCMPESVRDRPTTAHEYWFLLAKGPRYFWDADAVRVPLMPASAGRYAYDFGGDKSEALVAADKEGMGVRTRVVGARGAPAGRNLRTSDVFYQGLDDLIEQERAWLAHLEHVRAQGGMLLDRGGDPLALLYPTFAFPGAHFATFSPHMITPLLKAATSERGCCPACRAPWVRVVEKNGGPPKGSHRKREDFHQTPYNEGAHPDGVLTGGALSAVYAKYGYPKTETVGWRPSCACPPADAVPCLVLDCFAGSGTVGLVARRLGRRFVGLDLNPEYVALARTRIEQDAPLFNGAAPAPDPAPERTLFDSLAPKED